MKDYRGAICNTSSSELHRTSKPPQKNRLLSFSMNIATVRNVQGQWIHRSGDARDENFLANGRSHLDTSCP